MLPDCRVANLQQTSGNVTAGEGDPADLGVVQGLYQFNRRGLVSCLPVNGNLAYFRSNAEKFRVEQFSALIGTSQEYPLSCDPGT
jgi:hypothetical protein